jgi:hypothetical protein
VPELRFAYRAAHRYHRRLVILSLLYLVLRRVFALRSSASGETSKDVEIAVLHHHLKVLRRQVARPSFSPIDRAFLAAASR